MGGGEQVKRLWSALRARFRKRASYADELALYWVERGNEWDDRVYDALRECFGRVDNPAFLTRPRWG